MCHACYYLRKVYGVTLIVSRLELVAGLGFSRVRVLSMPWLTKTFFSWSRSKMLSMADCWKQVSTEQQGKTGILPSLHKILELQTWERKKKKPQLGYVHAKTRWSWKRLLSNISVAQSGVFFEVFVWFVVFLEVWIRKEKRVEQTNN